MKISFIGPGQVGGALTRRLASLKHEVFVANSRGPETLGGLVEATGATAVPAAKAAQKGSLIIVTIPMREVERLPRNLFSKTSPETIIIDTNNYFPQRRDGRVAAVEDGMVESPWVEQHLGRPVIKAFNNIEAADLLNRGLPAHRAGRIALPVAGDNQKSKSIVLQIADQLGSDGVDAGGLAELSRQQLGITIFCTNLDANGVQQALSKAKRERPPEFRAAGKSLGAWAAPA